MHISINNRTLEQLRAQAVMNTGVGKIQEFPPEVTSTNVWLLGHAVPVCVA